MKMSTPAKLPRPLTNLSSTAKKLKRKAFETARSKSRINIAKKIDAWNGCKAQQGLKFDHEVAGFLLALYESHINTEQQKRVDFQPKGAVDVVEDMEVTAGASQVQSTSAQNPASQSPKSHRYESPINTEQQKRVDFQPKVAVDVVEDMEVTAGASQVPSTSAQNLPPKSHSSSDVGDDLGSAMSGVQSLLESENDAGKKLHLSAAAQIRQLVCDTVESESDSDKSEDQGIDTIDIDKDDPIYEPELDTGVTESETDYDKTPQKVKLYDLPDRNLTKIMTDIDQWKDVGRMNFVYESNLLQLAKLESPAVCNRPNCGLPCEILSEKNSTATDLIWVCSRGHASLTWSSQPRFSHGIHTGDIQLASAILLSGNNYDKICRLFEAMSAPCLDPKLFNGAQNHYVIPAVDKMWSEMMEKTLAKYKDQDVIVCGDGRNDSPGYSAQYCTYTMMHHETLDILCMMTVDKRQTGGKSPNMEAYGFRKCMEYLDSKGIKVVEVVTDQHPTITSIMKKEFGCGENRIRHSFDIWHVAKNLLKKLAKCSDKKVKDILKWIPDIVKHFWWVCQNCQEDVALFKEMWRGLLHHVRGKHEWICSDGSIMRCQHDENFEERVDDLLKPTSDAMKALQKIVLDTRFLRQVPHLVRFRKTGELETFNNLILKYCSKRYSFSPPVYRARNRLAGLDYMLNKDRPNLINKDGKPRLNRCFNKKSKRWSVANVKVPKSYSHMCDLVKDIMKRKMDDKLSTRRMKDLSEDDPRNIQKVLVAEEVPDTQDIMKNLKSRFSTADYKYMPGSESSSD